MARKNFLEMLESRMLLSGVTPVQVNVGVQVIEASAAEGSLLGADFRITRDGDLSAGLPVTFGRGGTAKNATDYVLKLDDGVTVTELGKSVKVVTIPAGADHIDLQVVAVDDALAEATETMVLTLKKGKPYLLNPATTSGTVNILDNEPHVSIAATDATAAESGIPSTDLGMYRFSRDGGTTGNLVVGFKASGTAKKGKDFVLRLGSEGGPIITGKTVTIPDGQAFVDVFVDPLDDIATDPGEVATLAVAAGKTYTADPEAASANVTIVDNEPQVGIVTTHVASEVDPSGKGKGTFTIARSGSPVGDVVVNYQVNADESTATSGVDYVALSGTVTIPNGKKSVTVDVVAIPDALVEGSELLTVDLLPGAYTVSQLSTAVMTISDGPVAAQGLFGTVTFTETGFQDLTTTVPILGVVGGIRVSTGTFTSTNGRTGSYSYTSIFGPGESKHATLRLTFNGANPVIDSEAMVLTWNSAGARLEHVNGKTMSFSESSGGASGSVNGNGVVQVGDEFIDVQGFFTVS